MQSDSLCSDGITNPDEKRGDIVGSKWGRAINERGENEGILQKRYSDSLGPANDFILVRLKKGNANRIERYLPGVVRLRCLLGNSTGDYDHGTGHLDDSELQVHVCPTERTQLASSHHCKCSEHEERSKSRIALSGSVYDFSDDLNRGGIHPALGYSWRPCFFGNIFIHPSPADTLMRRVSSLLRQFLN